MFSVIVASESDQLVVMIITSCSDIAGPEGHQEDNAGYSRTNLQVGRTH